MDFSTTESNIQRVWTTYGGILMGLSASIFTSITFLTIKSLEKDRVKGFGAAVIFNIGILIPCSLAMIFNEFGPGWKKRSRVSLKPFRWKILWTLMIQGILQGSSVILRTLSLMYISVGDMAVIVFSSPIVTTILAHFIVKEKCGAGFIIIAFYTLLGVGLMTKPPVLTGAKDFDQHTLVGSALAGGAMLALSMKFVVTRAIKQTHFLTMTFFLGAFGFFISFPLFLIFEEPESLIPWNAKGSLLRIGLVSSFFAAASINLALKMENAGIVALVRSCDVIFAFLLQFIFFGVIPDWLSGIGAFIVWSGVVLVGFIKWRTERNTKSERQNDDIKNGDPESNNPPTATKL